MYQSQSTGLVVLFVIIAAIVIFFLGRKNPLKILTPTLVLRKFDVNEEAIDENYFKIVGRSSGISAWILTVLRLDIETHMSLNKDTLVLKSSSLLGEFNQVIPLRSISSTHCGYSKPIGYLVISAVLILWGLLSGIGSDGLTAPLVFGILAGAVFIYIYTLSKKISITLETNGGLIMGLTFKKSIIHNVEIDIQKAKQVIHTINKKINIKC